MKKFHLPKDVIWLLRILVPPHIDNEEAADFLRMEIGQNDNTIKWVVVRPSSLINEEDVSDYKTYTSPTRSAIFNDGKVSRVNVAAFMSKSLQTKIYGKNGKVKCLLFINLTIMIIGTKFNLWSFPLGFWAEMINNYF